MKSTVRTLAIAALLVLSISSAGSSEPLVSPLPSMSDDVGIEWSVDPSGECCKVCTKGKACGDSCIARDKDCHQPPGCACDG